MRHISCLTVIAGLMFTSLAFGQKSLSSAQLRHKLEQTTVLVRTNVGYGTGWVIDRSDKLIATANHVVQRASLVGVHFPVTINGQCVHDVQEFDFRSPQVSAEVVATSPDLDLAILRVAHLPENVVQLPLAKSSPIPGSTVFSVSHAKKLKTVYNFAQGKVAFTGFAAVDGRRDQQHDAVLRADVFGFECDAVDKGSSGCALVNNQGELVGFSVLGAGLLGQSKVTCVGVSVRELHRLINPGLIQTASPRSLVGRWVGDQKGASNEVAFEFFNNGKAHCIVPGGGKLIGTYRLVGNDMHFTTNGKTDVMQLQWVNDHQFRLVARGFECSCKRHDGGWKQERRQ